MYLFSLYVWLMRLSRKKECQLSFERLSDILILAFPVNDERHDASLDDFDIG